MSDPNEPPRPPGPPDESGSGQAPPPPPFSEDNPYGAASGGGGADYGSYGGGGDGYGAPPPGGPYGAPPGDPYGVAGETPGGLGARFLARLIDGILLGIVTGIIDAILAAIFGVSQGGLGLGGSYAYAAIAAIIGTVVNLGYFGYLESSRGQTLGKMVLKLHVQTMEGGLPTFEQAIRRNIWLALALLGIIPFIGGLIGGLGELAAVIMIAVGISNDPARRPWTDKSAGTRVLKRTS